MRPLQSRTFTIPFILSATALLSLLLLLTNCGETVAQVKPGKVTIRHSAVAKTPAKTVKQAGNNALMTVGVYYYPEQWHRSQWNRDLANMAKMGFEFTHVGEFAWERMEPAEGVFNFGWLDTVLALTQANGLKMVLCTPTPTPPAWLTNKYPDVLLVKASGDTARHQGRTHGSWSSPRYQQFCRRIVSELAKRYANHPAVIGWQIDNEPSHYGKVDHSENARRHFIQWLQQRYKTLTALNSAWGTPFWSNQYSDWDQIRTPNKLESTAGENPHQALDFKRFQADACAEFIRMQQQELRKYVPANVWITTNYMHNHAPVDPWRNGDLDMVTYTMYPISSSEAQIPNSESVRMGNSISISYANDLFRSINGRTGVMELQPGQVNWAWVNTQPMPGAIRMWLWNSFAGGLELACSYRYRQPLYGSELYHYGMIGPDGVTPSPGGKEFSQFIQELKTIRQLPATPPPASWLARQVAILRTPDQEWLQEIFPQSKHWPNYGSQLKRWHQMLKRFMAPVDFVDTLKSWDKYPILVVPTATILTPGMVKRLEAYARNGGHLVLNTRAGTHTYEGKVHDQPWATPVLPLIGAKAIKYFDMLPKEATPTGTIKWVGPRSSMFNWHIWADVVEPETSTEVWAKFTNQFYAGSPAITHQKLGKGSVTYLAAMSDTDELEAEVIRKLYQLRGITTLEVPNTLKVEWRHGCYIACNYGITDAQVPASAKAKFLFGGVTIPPAGVAVWQEP